MKNTIKIAFAMLCFSVSCAVNNNRNAEIMSKMLVDSGEYTFMARRAHPMGIVVAQALQSVPNANRVTELDYGYTIKLKNNDLEVNLPYFGRVYTAITDPQKNGYHFESKQFTISEKATKKKNTRIFYIVPNDVSEVQQIIIEITSKGEAFVSISSNERQPISYSGFITENEK